MDEEVVASEPAKKRKFEKRPLWQRIMRGFVIVGCVYTQLLIAFVVLAGAGFTYYLTTSAGKERVRALVEKRLQDKVNGTVTLRSVDYELMGPIELKGLSIADENGKPVVVLDDLRVAPDWHVLASRKAIAVEEIDLTGLHLTIIKDADGGSNLKRLVKKQEGEETEQKPIDKLVEIRKIALSDVDVTVISPDGTELMVEDLALEGSAHGVPGSKDLALTLKPIALDFSLKKPPGADAPAGSTGMKVGLKNIKTGIAVDLAGGKGKATIDPLSADLSLSVPDKKIEQSFPIGWGGF